MKHPMDDQHLRRDGSSERSSENDTSIILVRYLTPYKIAVAIVIVLYLSGLIPQSQKPRVMGYIISFLDTQIKQHDALMESTIESDLSALENVLSRCPAVNSLGKRVHSDGRERDDGGLFNSLLDILFTMSSIDELHTFINRLPLFVIKGDGKHDDEDNDKIAEAQSLGVNWVTQSSVLGTYFTKCFLSFDSLTFDQAIVLWNCLIAFRSPYQTKIPPHPFALKNFSNFSDSSNSLFKAFFGPHFSQTDSHGFNFLQHLLPPPQPIRCVASETLDMVLESKVSTLDRSDGISLHSINRILSTLSENDKSLPVSAHYIKYFSSLQEHDYEQAFEHLHRFYDYTMHRHGRAQYHNALFTLATLHAEFESFEEALRAVSEAISVARENKDISALTNIHFWLYNFITLHPDCKIPEFFSSKEQMLQFLKVKSQDTSLGLYSLTLQHEALHHLVTCGSLTQTLEALFKSSFISIISNSISSAISYCSLMVSTCNRLGISSSALLYNELSSDLSKKASNTWPIIESTIQRAELLFEKGELSNAFKLLESVRPLARESQLSYRQWYWSYMLLKLKHSINENKLDEASFILERLAPLANLSYRTRANHQIYKILLLSKSGAKTLAKEQAWSLIDSLAKEDSDILYSLRLMVIYIEIILENERSAKSLSTVLRLIFLSEKASIPVYKCYGIIFLARISRDEMESSDSISLIDSIMPKILETENAHLIAFGYRTLGEATISTVTVNSSFSISDSEAVSLIEKSLGYLKKAAHFYARIQDWDSLMQTSALVREAASRASILANSPEIQHFYTADYQALQCNNVSESTDFDAARLCELTRQNRISTSLGTRFVPDDVGASACSRQQEDEPSWSNHNIDTSL